MPDRRRAWPPDGNSTVIGKVSKALDAAERIAAGRLLPPE
jgi:hypothetical protein